MIKDSKGNIKTLMIRFDKEFHGAQMQLKYPRLMSNYLGCPPIEKCLLSYTQSKIHQYENRIYNKE